MYLREALRWLLIALVGAGASCATRVQPESAVTCAATEDAIGAAAAALIESDNRRDVDGVLAGYTDDVIWLTPDGRLVRGKESLRPRYEQMFDGKRVELTVRIEEAHGSGEIGYARGVTGGQLVPLDGSPPEPVGGRFLALTRCESGRWRVSHLMWTARTDAQAD